MATHLYTGIAFDTKLFKFSSPERALKACAELVDLGANPQQIADALFAQQSYESVKTLGIALSTLKLHCDGKISTMYIDHATYALGGDLDLVVDYAMAIAGVEVGVLFKEEAPGLQRISLRSRGRVDVNEIARQFGGGGHQSASGCRLEAPREEAQRKLMAEVERRVAEVSETPLERER